MQYDINRPWLSLDAWQKEYIESPPNQNCFLLCGRQVGKTTAMSIKAVELCANHFNKGENILIASITEKQGYLMLSKAKAYAEANYSKYISKGKDKPTMHILTFTNGTKIFCYAAGETGEGLRGFTIKKLMCDEGSRMTEEFFIATTPMLSVVAGSMDIASTPCGKEGFFYRCSLDDNFKKFYVSAEDCPRHDKEFLAEERKRMSKLRYSQEYLAMFLSDLKRVFSEELIKNICILKRRKEILKGKTYYLGCDIAGMGEAENTFEVLHKINNETIEQVENEILKEALTTQTSNKILSLNRLYNFKKIGIDDAGVGFGVFSELMSAEETKRKTEALNNASRPLDKDGEKFKKLLKEEMYINLLTLMEQNKIKLLDDDEIKASLSSVQFENEEKEGKTEFKIFGDYTHIVEGIIRSSWLCSKDKSLNVFARTF